MIVIIIIFMILVLSFLYEIIKQLIDIRYLLKELKVKYETKDN